jgi:transcriptional regulator with XRE-family HTH domain
MSRSKRSDIDRFVAHRIKELRLRTGMTQHQVAKQLGVTATQVHKFETGRNRLSASQLLAIARGLDVTVADLFHGYDGGAPLRELADPESSRLLHKLSRRFLELEAKDQEALLGLARALAAEG